MWADLHVDINGGYTSFARGLRGRPAPVLFELGLNRDRPLRFYVQRRGNVVEQLFFFSV